MEVDEAYDDWLFLSRIHVFIFYQNFQVRGPLSSVHIAHERFMAMSYNAYVG
jgi:uncharacterized protein Usg